ncbi:hypothetical protein FHS30_000817 [Simiduia aestuariiviva]|uniref:Uncharacterized protein n=1 Tax=Simiduia aestuariiviva TaxID=1510459 RepID=A0A839ULK3_9GAMM|nr:hypothetical protein [Simiduia aestuariiviva]
MSSYQNVAKSAETAALPVSDKLKLSIYIMSLDKISRQT